MLKIRTLLGLAIVNACLRCGRLRWQGVRIGWGGWIKSRITVGRGTGIAGRFVVRGAGTLTIGRYCAIGEAVRILTSNHDMARLSINYHVQDRLLGRRFVARKRDVLIGNDVWIGDGATILPGVTVGDGAVIGAGAVVARPVEPFQVVVGNPATVLKHRFPPEVAARIAELAWWNWSEEEQRRHAELFAAVYTAQDAAAILPGVDEGAQGSGEKFRGNG